MTAGTAALAIGGVLLAGMVVAAGYAVARLPAGARVPLHAGTPEYSVWLSKWAGLAVWLAAGAATFAILAFLTLSDIAANWATSVRVVLLPSVMCVALAAEAAAIIMARQRCAAQQPAEAVAPAEPQEPAGPAKPAEPAESAPTGETE